jgi:hypothetical protein
MSKFRRIVALLIFFALALFVIFGLPDLLK